MSTSKALFFDMGWTLEDETSGQLDRALKVKDILASRGRNFDVATLMQYQLEAGRDGQANVYHAALARMGLTQEEILELRDLAKWDVNLCHLCSGVPQMLAELHARGWTLGIMANQSKPMTARLERYGIARYFTHVICSCEVGLDKPDPRIFQLAEERAAPAGPTEMWMVGDRVDNDVVPAKARGWKTVRVVQGDHRHYRSKSPEETPDLEIGDLRELPELLI